MITMQAIETAPKMEHTSPDAPSDEDLMRALQCGDDLALTALMERWELGVKTFLLRLGVPPSDVDDVAQEAFIRLYEKRSTFRTNQEDRGTSAAFKPWFLTIAANLGRNRLRWRIRRREESIENQDTHAFESTHTSRADGDTKEEIGAKVRAAIATLPEKLRRVVVCVELENLSYAEAAHVLDCTVKAIETRLYRARAALREKLQDVLSSES